MKHVDKFEYLKGSDGQLDVIKTNQGPVWDLLGYAEAASTTSGQYEF